MPSRQEVAQFLRDFCGAVELGHVVWLPRPEDRQHVIDLGITQNQALELIQGLTPDDYSQGPMPDDFNHNRDVWVFGCDVDGREAYVKLALQPDNHKRHVTHGLIWAFHPAEFPMSYPLRGKSK